LLSTTTVLEKLVEQQGKSGSTGPSQSPETDGNQLRGQLIHIEGWHYTIKDTTGQEVSFGITEVTKLLHPVKEGDHIIAMIGDGNIATSINLRVRQDRVDHQMRRRVDLRQFSALDRVT
jgi:hypothetical protein